MLAIWGAEERGRRKSAPYLLLLGLFGDGVGFETLGLGGRLGSARAEGHRQRHDPAELLR